VSGGAPADALAGNAGPDRLFGGDGAATLEGGDRTTRPKTSRHSGEGAWLLQYAKSPAAARAAELLHELYRRANVFVGGSIGSPPMNLLEAPFASGSLDWLLTRARNLTPPDPIAPKVARCPATRSAQPMCSAA
jgi:hypothetical protein